MWELPSGKCVATQRGVVGRGFCKFTLPDWSWSTPQLVCASMSGSGVRVWDMAAWEETAQLGHAGQEFYSVCTPAGSALVLGAAGDSQVGPPAAPHPGSPRPACFPPYRCTSMWVIGVESRSHR